jgi:hypothetical protein
MDDIGLIFVTVGISMMLAGGLVSFVRDNLESILLICQHLSLITAGYLIAVIGFILTIIPTSVRKR